MKLYYEEPLAEIRKYSLSPDSDVMTASEPDLENPDNWDIFGN